MFISYRNWKNMQKGNSKSTHNWVDFNLFFYEDLSNRYNIFYRQMPATCKTTHLLSIFWLILVFFIRIHDINDTGDVFWLGLRDLIHASSSEVLLYIFLDFTRISFSLFSFFLVFYFLIISIN